ncbi:RNA polymerase-binding ATPase [Oceanicoccus sagamiensis]|uniref:RNA polymerase-associated protein RapA n=1 Tax=Oceanicoccus sagamiensis TaxID=716816 RepID=A0A1X9NKS9_9GAMM|nr:RNA polymerase-binding ATPase [Oceanicoccus sagamiensis]
MRELFVPSPVFVPGQRWISNTESELGLGIVVELANRRVEISFPASGERRTYAVDNAPISRVQYEAGQQIHNELGELITVNDVLENQGCLIYNGVNEQGEAVILPEIDLNSFIQFSKPQDRLFAGQIDKNRAFQLRCQTLENIRHQQQSQVRGLLGPRVQLLPHQLYIASEAANRHAPRVLLADEVGLGKTIEAGLILHQQLISGRSKRVLVVVPDSLLHQWLVEMLRRFNLSFTILDEARCEGLEELGDVENDPFFDEEPTPQDDSYNPFESAQLVLCTLSFLTNNPERQAQAAAADWDLLIVDEAHHLQWSEAETSPAYRCIETLARQARGLLLLTATPEQLGVASHFARLRLLDPDRYYDLATFIEDEKKHKPVNELVQHLLADDVFEQLQSNPQLLQQLSAYLGDASVAPLQQALSGGGGEEFDQAIATVISDLLDRHGTGRVLFRNTRSSVAGFPDRQLHQYPLQPADRYNDAIMHAAMEELLAPELLLGSSWIAEDPRVGWLSSWLKDHRSEKVLVICARAETALDLEEHLRLRGGVQSAVFHEGLSLVARDRAAAFFADDEEGAQVLICSEIGSEGRNFQFSHHLVLFDLPLNPDLLEQRIGRLDRIGQRYTVDIHVPFYEDTAQQVLLRWYHEGINAFERTCPAGLALYQQFEQALIQCLNDGDNGAAMEQLISETKTATAATLQTLQQGRDRLLELNSCNHEKADAIVETMIEEERRQELSNYMEQVFDQYGVEQEHHSAASVILRPGDHMLEHSFPGLTEEGVTATYSREVALSREDMQFLSWEHPMVAGAMDMVLSGEFGNTAFCTLKLPPLKAGTVLLEAIFIVHCTAPSELQIQRYLPLTTMRIVVDSNNTDLSKVLTPAHLDKLGQKVPKRSAQDLIRHARPQISAMISRAEQLAEPKKDGLIEEAAGKMQTEQVAELGRLKALAAVNPNIRQEEVEYLKQSAVSLQRYLQGAQLKLDAVRVALVTD